MASPFDTPLDPASKLGSIFILRDLISWKISYISSFTDSLTPTYSEKFLWYDYRCQSEPVRQVKGMKILSIAACPVTEKQICLFHDFSTSRTNSSFYWQAIFSGLVLNTGKLIFLDVEKTQPSCNGTKAENSRLLSDVFPPSTSVSIVSTLNLAKVFYNISFV